MADVRRWLIGCEESGLVRDAIAELDPGAQVWSADILPSARPARGGGCGEVRYLENGITPYDPDAPGYHYQGDVRDLFDWNHPVNREAQERALNRFHATGEEPAYLWDAGIFFPPCTHLSQAGAVHWKHKDARRGGDGRMQEGAAFFMEMVNAPVGACAVENPVGVMCRPADRERDGDLAVGYRPPDQVVEPFWFGDPLRKRTCLWLRGLPPLTADRLVEPTGRVATGGGSWRTDQRAGRGANNGHEDGKGRKNRQRERNRTLPGLARAMAEQWTAFVEAQEQAA